VAFADDKGTHCIPTACWREGDYLCIHGSNGGRLIKQLLRGTQACVTLTHIDGLVLARSVFNTGMNFRSAMVYGVFEAVADKRAALTESACKVRSGGPKDDEADMALPVWAGTLPLVLQAAPAVVDPLCNVAVPDYVQQWSDRRLCRNSMALKLLPFVPFNKRVLSYQLRSNQQVCATSLWPLLRRVQVAAKRPLCAAAPCHVVISTGYDLSPVRGDCTKPTRETTFDTIFTHRTRQFVRVGS